GRNTWSRAPHPPLRGTLSRGERDLKPPALSHRERVAEGRVRGHSKSSNKHFAIFTLPTPSNLRKKNRALLRQPLRRSRKSSLLPERVSARTPGVARPR